MPQEKKYGFFSSLIIIISAMLIVLLLLEFILRVGAHFMVGTAMGDLRVYIPDNELCWRTNPSYHGPALGCKKIKFNRLGFRGEDYSKVPKNQKTLRLMVLGDSNTAGWSLADDEKLYPRILEKALNDKLRNSRKVEVANMGAIGYTSYQGVILLKRLFEQVKPDIVVVMYGANDAVVFGQPDKVKLDPLYNNMFMGTIDNSMIYQSLKFIIRKATRKIMLNKERERRAKLAAGPKSLSLRVPPADFKENIFQIAEYTASKKAKLVLITYPSSQEDIKLKEIMQQYRQAEYECQKQIGGYVFDFSSLADSHPIKEIFQNSPQDPVHLTYAGHRLLGETLADFIYQNELAK